jgi:hypothetical protein
MRRILLSLSALSLASTTGFFAEQKETKPKDAQAAETGRRSRKGKIRSRPLLRGSPKRKSFTATTAPCVTEKPAMARATLRHE